MLIFRNLFSRSAAPPAPLSSLSAAIRGGRARRGAPPSAGARRRGWVEASLPGPTDGCGRSPRGRGGRLPAAGRGRDVKVEGRREGGSRVLLRESTLRRPSPPRVSLHETLKAVLVRRRSPFPLGGQATGRKARGTVPSQLGAGSGQSPQRRGRRGPRPPPSPIFPQANRLIASGGFPAFSLRKPGA